MGKTVGGIAGQYIGTAIGSYFGYGVGGQIGGIAGKYAGEYLGEQAEKLHNKTVDKVGELTDKLSNKLDKLSNKLSKDKKDNEKEQEQNKEKEPNQQDDQNIEDNTTNGMTYKVFDIPKSVMPEYDGCPTAYRDEVADQYTPQDDLITMEKLCRDFFKLEEKVYDPETTNPRFFASEQWVLNFEKDKNVVLALLDQYKANVLKMEHLYMKVDDQSMTCLGQIQNQNQKSTFQTKSFWSARALKDWSDGWFIRGDSYTQTRLYDSDHWVPGLTGTMISWMKTGTYEEWAVQDVSTETMIRKADLLEEKIDRLENEGAVSKTVSQYVNLKETLEQSAKQAADGVFTSKVIDSQMGKKLGVVDTGIENYMTNLKVEKEVYDKEKDDIVYKGDMFETKEGTKYAEPKADEVESVKIGPMLSPVKTLFKELRKNSIEQLKKRRQLNEADADQYPEIWKNIDKLAEPVYKNLGIMNELVEDIWNDSESPGKHCSVTHEKLCPDQLKTKITALKCVIQEGVVDVMTNQAMLPKNGGMNILDSMWNQLWEYGERGPTIDLPDWCKMAIEGIRGFERTMIDAWNEVFDCWEREFITRIWRLEVEHHSSNWERSQTKPVESIHNHVHPIVPLTMLTLATIGGDTSNLDLTPLSGILTCPGHIEELMKPVCVQYRIVNIAHLSRHYIADIKSLCNWLVSAIEAVGIKLVTISAVMSDPTLSGNDGNKKVLKQISELREKNAKLREQVETAYCSYRNVGNMKNKKNYDDQIALQELQPNKYSNEDQLNMTSSLQSETNQSNLKSLIAAANVDIPQLMPWHNLNLSENHQEGKPIPCTCKGCNMDDVIKQIWDEYSEKYGFKFFDEEEMDNEIIANSSTSSTNSTSSPSSSTNSTAGTSIDLNQAVDFINQFNQGQSGNNNVYGTDFTSLLNQGTDFMNSINQDKA